MFLTNNVPVEHALVVDEPIKRTINVYESQRDAKELHTNNWKFHIAKSVATSNPPTKADFNVVWQSKSIAPNFTISWNDRYGLNWTQRLPGRGAEVIAGGVWQACSLGQVFDIDKEGFWVQSSVASEPGFMKVGKVDYQYPGTDGLHVIVGIETSNGDFDSVFVDPNPLALGSSATYKPQEKVQWWYQSDGRAASMITSASTAIESKDMSKADPGTGQFSYHTTYTFKPSPHWNTSPLPPS